MDRRRLRRINELVRKFDDADRLINSQGDRIMVKRILNNECQVGLDLSWNDVKQFFSDYLESVKEELKLLGFEEAK